MNLEFKEITIKNFLSFGNVPQTLQLNDTIYQVIVGLNKDKSDSQSDRNGVGKSSIFEAIHYALFGKSIGNKVTLGNLINKLNKKNMLVTLKFCKNGIDYEIIRGRSPNILKFLKNGVESVQDESQGDSRETQSEIEKVLGLNDDVFNQIVCLSCKVPMFLDQTTTNQKQILEKILGIDIISEKIDLLKVLIKDTKNELNNEQFKYNTIETQNNNLTNSIQKQYDDMVIAKNKWYQDIRNNITNIENQLKELSVIDIDTELNNFKLLEEYIRNEGVNLQNEQLKISIKNELSVIESDINDIQKQALLYQGIDFNNEKDILKYNDELKKEYIEYQKLENDIVNKRKILDMKKSEYDKLNSDLSAKNDLLSSIKPDVCPTCGNEMDIEHFNKLKDTINSEIISIKEKLHVCDLDIMELMHDISVFNVKNFEFKISKFNSLTELLNAENNLLRFNSQLQECYNRKDKLTNELNNIKYIELGSKPTVYYNNIDDALNHRNKIKELENSKQMYMTQLNSNPFEQQEKSIIEMKNNLMVLDDSRIIELKNDLEHQELLLKLLNNPSSFIRKAILDKSLLYLNTKINEYLIMLGSLHNVSFNNDMSINIQYMGNEYGYVSSGEMGRISIALILSFRDVWESLNDCKINCLFIDEIVDRLGLDTAGVEMMVECLKHQDNKNVMLVTHNELLINQATNILTVIKNNCFTDIIKGII